MHPKYYLVRITAVEGLWPDHATAVSWPMSVADRTCLLSRVFPLPASGAERPRYTVLWLMLNIEVSNPPLTNNASDMIRTPYFTKYTSHSTGIFYVRVYSA